MTRGTIGTARCGGVWSVVVQVYQKCWQLECGEELDQMCERRVSNTMIRMAIIK